MKFSNFWFLAVIATAMVACEHVPFLDTVPLISQLKSGFQLVTGDKNGATETLKHYLNDGIGPAQARSAYFLVTGNPEKALEIQKKFVKNMEVLLDGAPVIGHIKGVVHLIEGDEEHGWEAIKSATSTTGSAIGGILGGPVGVIVGHTITDAAISGLDAAINGNNSQPFGLVEYVSHIGELSAGDHFDMIAGLVMDGTTGKLAKNKKTVSKPKAPVGENIDILHESYRESEIKGLPQHERAKQLEIKCSPQHERVKEFKVESLIQHEQLKESEIEGLIQHEQLKESEIEGLLQHEHVKEFEIEGSPQHERLKESEIEGPWQHEPPSMSLTRVGTQPSLDMQVERRSALDLISLTPDEIKNNIAFFKFFKFVHEASVYAYFKMTGLEYSDIVKKTFTGLQQLRHTYDLMRININTIKSKFSYLTDAQKSLITIEDFRTVNNLPDNSANCLGCSVAGILKEDVETLQSRLGDIDNAAYDPNEGGRLHLFLEECRRKNLLNFKMSPLLDSLDKLNGYLKANSRHLENKQLLLAEITQDIRGHCVVIRFKMVDGKPVTILVDYQLPGFLNVNLPNPFRISPYIDTIHYKYFYVVNILDP